MSPSKIATKTIEGFAAKAQNADLTPIRYDSDAITGYSILVKITHCGICHSDLHLIRNDWNNAIYPLVPGHEIIGIVVEKGEMVSDLEIGDRVGIGWQKSSCGSCEWCRSAEENLCYTQEATCIGHPGGFANFIVSDSRFAFHIPEKLASENAAPLLCGGATVFSPFVQFNVDATWRIGIIGIGGLGHLAIQFAKAFGCEVYVFSSSPAKEKEAKEFGAHHFISSSDKESIQRATNSLDLLLFTSSAAADFIPFFNTLRPKGKLCLLGAPENGHIDLPIFNFIVNRKMVCGSNIASPHVIQKMLQFAARHHIVAKTELFHMSEVNKALKKLAANEIHYRAVLYN